MGLRSPPPTHPGCEAPDTSARGPLSWVGILTDNRSENGPVSLPMHHSAGPVEASQTFFSPCWEQIPSFQSSERTGQSGCPAGSFCHTGSTESQYLVLTIDTRTQLEAAPGSAAVLSVHRDAQQPF